MVTKIEVLICYAQNDHAEMKELAIYLGALRRQGIFEAWHAQQVSPVNDWSEEVKTHLMTAQIIVLLVSQYFLDSDYCFSVQMKAAMERHHKGEACVLPVILRPVYFSKTFFAGLQPLPTKGKPIKKWRNQDEAFFNVSEGIRLVAERGCGNF